MRRPCPAPLCGELVEGGGRCPTHRREADRRRGTPAERGYDARWEATRAAYLDTLRRRDAEGLARCEECGKPETPDDPLHVDHIDGLGPLAPRGHDPTNLQALCQPDHSRKTQAQTRLRSQTRRTR